MTLRQEEGCRLITRIAAAPTHRSGPMWITPRDEYF
jgi:hypothetical protein